jgi:hypothetical protein
MKNRKSHANSASQYKGVYQSGLISKPWRASIYYDGQDHRLGFFASEIVAALAYDRAAEAAHGEFARLNFPTNRDWIFAQERAEEFAPLSSS